MSIDTRLVENFWHLACHRRELQESGDFIRFELLDKEVVVFNDCGNILAFDNRCPHRGARIYVDDFGNQSASCSYHGWTYHNGKLIVPDREKFVGCNIEDARINAYRVDWCGDFLFFGIAPKQGLYEQLGGVAEVLENISFNVDRRHDLNRYRYECYWPLAVENALEPYHISHVHPSTLASLELQDGENLFHGVNSIWYAPVGSAKLRKQLYSLRRFFHIDYQYEGYMSVYLFPFTMISSTYGYSYSVQNFFPDRDGLDRTNFTSRLLTVPPAGSSAAQILTAFWNSSAELNRRVFEEDASVCKRMPRDSWAPAALEFFSMMDEKINHFRDSVRRYTE